jgi:hypothetical protein
MLKRLLEVTCACALLSLAVASNALASSGSLRIVVRGLPRGSTARYVVQGPGLDKSFSRNAMLLGGLPAGRYRILVRTVRVRRGARSIVPGATAFPSERQRAFRVRGGRATTMTIAYGAIVNPRVEPLPSAAIGVIGNPNAPQAILLRAARGPRRGTIFTSGPRAFLPSGLVARVTGVTRDGGLLDVSVTPVSIVEAVPQLDYTGSLPLKLTSNEIGAGGSSSPQLRAHAAGGSPNCASPRLLNFSADLDSVEVRQAFLGAWPPQMRLTLAVRTTETLGVAAAAVGIDCSFDLGGVGPFQGEIPVGPVVIPVYATFPVQASIDVSGRLDVGTFNVASTTVAEVAAGFDQNSVSLSQQGSNVWISGSPSLSGSAELSASIGMQAGVGIAKGANVHVEADFGPDFTWHSSTGCELDVDLGSLSAGVQVFGRSLNSPTWTPFVLHLWKGCTPALAGSPGVASGGGQPSPPSSGGGSVSTSGSSNPGGDGTTAAGPVPGGTIPETVGGVTDTWTDYADAGGGEGSPIENGQTVGVACRVQGFAVADGNTWWYRIASSPWSSAYYASADAFYNDGATSGSLQNTPFYDPNVPVCPSSGGGSSGGGGGTPAQTYAETTGSVANTWTDYGDAGGTEGPQIGSNQTVQIACWVTGFRVADGNTYWYEVASSPWNDAYYVSADAFYNNGETSGTLSGTPFVDPTVPACAGSSGGTGGSKPTYAETTGSVAHTWTDYADAGGAEGPEIASNETVQIACWVSGFKVADGNTYWYEIASSPWNDAYYVSADAFYNNGETSGSLLNTPFVDPAVPEC